MEKVVLHLGVHKTATTYIQSRFYNSRDELKKKGIGYLGLKKTRENITSKLKKGMSFSEDVKVFFASNNKVLISDENILGGTVKPKGAVIYDKASERLEYLVKALNCKNIDVHLTIRDPEKYLVSRYCEYLRHYKFMPIHEYFDQIFLRDFSWLPLIREIERTTKTSVNVTTFEKFLDDENAYFNKILGESVTLLEASDGPGVKRSKVSDEAYNILVQISKSFPGHVTKKVMNILSNNKQVGRETPLQPFGEDLSMQLQENYKKDKIKLKVS